MEFHPGTSSWKKGRWGGIPPWNFIMEKGEEFHPGTSSWRKGRWGGIPPWNFIMEKGEMGRNSTQELHHGERGGRVEYTTRPRQERAHIRNRHNLYSVLMQKSELTPTTDNPYSVLMQKSELSSATDTTPTVS